MKIKPLLSMIPSIWCRALVPAEEKHSIMNMIYVKKNKPGNYFFYTKSVFCLKRIPRLPSEYKYFFKS